MAGRQCLPSDSLSLSQNNKFKDTLESEEEKCQRNKISPEASMDFYNAVSGDFMLPVVVTWGSFTRP